MYWGIDGCKGGWIATGLAPDTTDIIGDFYPSIGDFWAANGDSATLVLIDMPIGLPESEQRSVEGLAREKLQGRRSSVFPVPARKVVEFAAKEGFANDAYRPACDINEEVLGKRFSKQAWNILPKIHQVDTFLQASPDTQSKILEAHPELLFWALNGQQPMRYSKQSGVGFTERVDLLRQHLPTIFDDITQIYDVHKSVLGDDDIVDAIACALCAKLGNLTSLPNPPEVDSTGLPMQMVYPQL